MHLGHTKEGVREGGQWPWQRLKALIGVEWKGTHLVRLWFACGTWERMLPTPTESKWMLPDCADNTASSYDSCGYSNK